MRWVDEITLIAQTPPAERVNENGFPNEAEETRTTIFCNVKSVGFSEFYEAAKAGYEAALKVDVYAEEYEGQRLAEYDGVRYKVLRTYKNPKKPDEIELTLSDLTEVTDDPDEEDGDGTEGGGEDGEI